MKARYNNNKLMDLAQHTSQLFKIDKQTVIRRLSELSQVTEELMNIKWEYSTRKIQIDTQIDAFIPEDLLI